MLTPGQARARWPFAVPDGFRVCFTPSGGYLRVRACLDALRDQARAAGASFRYGAPVESVEPERARVRLEGGETVEADAVVVAAGAYTAALVPEFLGPGLFALRRVLVWTRPDGRHRSSLEAMPVWGAFVPEGFFYGFPCNREGIDGVKLACHTSGALPGLDDPVDPETVDRELRPSDVEPLAGFLRRYLPAAASSIIEHRVCMYGATPSWDFVVDHHPASTRTVVAAGFSGHGFKFAPVLGELAADLVEQRESPWQRPAFRRGRHQGETGGR
jgi:glycine/D-amino acid oxidase-like deaminating enzyme